MVASLYLIGLAAILLGGLGLGAEFAHHRNDLTALLEAPDQLVGALTLGLGALAVGLAAVIGRLEALSRRLAGSRRAPADQAVQPAAAPTPAATALPAIHADEAARRFIAALAAAPAEPPRGP